MVFEAGYVGFNFSVLNPRDKPRFHRMKACLFTRLQDFKAARKNVCQLPGIMGAAAEILPTQHNESYSRLQVFQ